MTTFDGWDARVGHNGRQNGASMMSRDAPGWAMTYQGEMVHGGTFGRGHYRGDRGVRLLYGSQAHAKQRAVQAVQKPAYSSQGIVGGFEWRSPNHLNHFRTKGSKNGVRRYQNEDGSWTPLGLKERRAREGFGERRAARKEARAQRRAAAKAYIAEQKRLRDPKRMTDAELRKSIERKKLEQEYRELNRSPLLKTAQGMLENYAKSKAEKELREIEKYKLETDRIKAVKDVKAMDVAKIEAKTAEIETKKGTNYLNAKKAYINAKNGTDRMAAKKDLKAEKNKERANTVRGAVSKLVHDVIAKEGSRIVGDMKSHTVVTRAGQTAKAGAKWTYTHGKEVAQKLLDKYRYGKAMGSGSGPNLN